MRRTSCRSRSCTSVSFFSRRIRLAGFAPIRWRLPEWLRRNFPVAVFLKRFAAPRCVFSFGICLSSLLSQGSLGVGSAGFRRAPGLRRAYGRGCAFLWRQNGQQDVGFHPRCGFHLAEGLNFFFRQQARHLSPADLRVSHFAPPVENHGLDLVAVREKRDDAVLPNLVIVLGGGGPELHFLDVAAAVVLALLVVPLVFFVAELAEVHDLADRRHGCRRNLHQIQPRFPGLLHGLERLHDPELPAICVNPPDFTFPDAFIYAVLLIDPDTHASWPLSIPPPERQLPRAV